VSDVWSLRSNLILECSLRAVVFYCDFGGVGWFSSLPFALLGELVAAADELVDYLLILGTQPLRVRAHNGDHTGLNLFPLPPHCDIDGLIHLVYAYLS